MTGLKIRRRELIYYLAGAGGVILRVLRGRNLKAWHGRGMKMGVVDVSEFR
jgi:hypothetical protein